ncbi:MAG: Asp-tRNA(Asn)/Glu-tRNA(Gln) amidotransferase GatCAB subunit C [Proteobacteria bacterium]|nr:Asp-tRNA(Asn)/Glu-tRNA(Gln) amidotransferase GatCAB subunit C [Pseudomonadota bacterium]NBX86376.1 Asp-tRNA(Asn)/Glu-tRNA(Gln) amidotransferase GatCAB subunit C [Pseudomonadota bacterium]
MDKTQLDKLAMLSRLEFTPEKLASFEPSLRSVLAFVEKIGGVDTAGIPPMAGVTTTAGTPERADVAVIPADPVARRAELQACAPKTEMGFYVVPKIVE